MSRPCSRIAAWLAIVAAIASAGGVVRADPDPADRAREAPHVHEADDADLDHEGSGQGRPRFDYSRFSDGPRRVPTPRGASKARAEALGLGTAECASRLLHGRPDEAWVAAAGRGGGREPSRLLWPVDDGRWVRGYGYVRTTRPDLLHRGVDIAADVGAVVRAAADGIVAYSDNGVRGYGNLVLIVHPNGWVTLYAHNSRTTVPAGYRVRRGERIALVGQTGIARGPHLHFELWQNGRAVDPAPLFDGGPTFVQRIAEREAARGRVAPPQEVSTNDRPIEAPLPPHPDDLASGAPTITAAATRTTGGGGGAEARAAASTAARPTGAQPEPPATEARAAGARAAEAPAEARRDDARTAEAHTAETRTAEPRTRLRELGGLELGSLALARRLLARAPTDAMLAPVGGRLFSNLLFPVRGGTVARPFRSSRAPMQLAGEPGAPVRAAADGLVAFAGELPGRGRSIVLVHRSGWVTAYVGLGELAVEVGAQVERGAWIGRTGEQPIELELRIGGVARDPGALLVVPGS